MLVIGVTGKKRHGKDTVSDYLVKKHGFKKYGFADSLKRGIKELFGLTNEQLWGKLKEDKDSFWGYSPRELMQIVGTDLIRDKFDNDFFVKSLKKKILEENEEKVVISDVRFLNEVDMVKSLKGKILKVRRDCVQFADTHYSENCLEEIEFYTIENNEALEDLYPKIDLFLDRYAYVD